MYTETAELSGKKEYKSKHAEPSVARLGSFTLENNL